MKALLMVIGLASLGCSRRDSLNGSYTLRLIGSSPASVVASDSAHCDVPFSSQYQFVSRRWQNLDSISVSQRCGSEGLVVRSDSGHFKARGDTIDLFVADTAIGEKGRVAVGFLRGDTLVFLGSDVEPGDWIYVRR